jgi:Family of unknown function (DUF6492)
LKYTFVTVAHQADLEFLRLQARSMNLYLSRSLVAEILIIEDARGKQPDNWSRLLRSDYGNLADSVRLIEGKEVADIPRTASGWFSQQILKMAASRTVETERYVVLDAKNHLVFPLTRDFLEADDKIRSRLVNYERHPLKSFFERTLRYFDIDPSQHIRAFLPTVTPFSFPTKVVQELVEYVAGREKESFPVAFLKLGVTEFFLFAAFISSLKPGIESFYDFSGKGCPTIWEEGAVAGANAVAELVTHGEKNRLAFFAVHRRALRKLEEESRRIIADFWRRRGLFESSAQGLKLLNSRYEINKNQK